MIKKRYEKLLPEYGKSSKGILDLATYIVDHHITDMNYKPLVGEKRMEMIKSMAHDLGTGSNYSKNKYMFCGVLLGVGITLVAVGIITEHFKEES